MEQSLILTEEARSVVRAGGCDSGLGAIVDLHATRSGRGYIQEMVISVSDMNLCSLNPRNEIGG